MITIRTVLSIMVFAAVLMGAGEAFARDRHDRGHHGHRGHHSRSGVSITFGGYYGDPYYPRYYRSSGYYPYYYSYAPPPPVIYSPPPTVIYTPSALPANQASETYIDDYGNTCREYQTNAQIGGVLQQTYGTACLQADGTWRVVR